MLEKIYKYPLRLMSITGCIYLLMSIIGNFFTDFAYKDSIYPCSKTICLVVEGIVLIIFVLSIFFYNKRILFYAGIELLIFFNIYTNNIYISLFLSSLTLVFLLMENIQITPLIILLYSMAEGLKLGMIIPYGTINLIRYFGLTLFAHSSIGCINLLFHHAYSKNETEKLNLDDYKFTDRQKDCIKEIVVNNTTIKELAINHNISESAIKKDLAYIYKNFGITGKADLKALFIGYDFSKM